MKKLLYILLLAPLLVFVSSCGKDIKGCTDSLAYNYNSEATIYDNTCEYLEIGAAFQGGIVFYIDETGEHGLVVALEDLGQFEWGCYGTGISAAAIGAGYQNTLDIVAGCSDTPIAASEALAYESGGYSDWYLPSKDELLEMYNTIGNGSSEGNIGGFSNSLYWSSSEYGNNSAWFVGFDSGYTAYFSKDNAGRVRVVRAF